MPTKSLNKANTREINWKQMFWLAVLSLGTSFTAIIIDESVLKITQFKISIREYYFYWVLASTFFAALAVSCIQYISPQAAGSGIPQMKAIMVGVTLPNMLSLRTLLAKFLGMIFMLGSGLSLGKEGPFVHIASCIAESLPYKEKKINQTLRHQFLTAAVAVGVAATFGAPIGGVLFGIEVSSSTYTVSNLWKAFFCSTIAVLCFKSFNSLGTAATFTADASYFYFGSESFGINIELPLFVILGCICGCLGTLYIAFQQKLNAWKKRMAGKYPKTFGNNYVYTLTVTVVLSSIIQYTRIMQTGDKKVIGETINIDQTLAKMDLTEETVDKVLAERYDFSWATMEKDSTWILYENYLLQFIIQKFLFTGLTLSCGIPGGIFTPTFAIGAVVGQLYVSIIRKALLSFGIYNYIRFRGVYSILGAAAMTSSVTRTISVAMIVLELNGHLSHAVPCMVCVLSSYFISEFLKPMSFFEMLSMASNLDKQVSVKGNIIIKDMIKMMPQFKDLNRNYLSLEDSTELDIIHVVEKHGQLDFSHSASIRAQEDAAKSGVFKQHYIPVVDNHEYRNLLFMVKVMDLQRYCDLHFNLVMGRVSAQEKQERARIRCGPILMSMKHVAPPILYQEASMSYMTENKAQKFYEGVPPPEDHVLKKYEENDTGNLVIHYCVVQTRYEKSSSAPTQQSYSIQDKNEDEEEEKRTIVGARLMGIIPCSDARGFDIMIKEYRAAEAEYNKNKKNLWGNLKRDVLSLGDKIKTKVDGNDDDSDDEFQNVNKMFVQPEMSEAGKAESQRRKAELDAKEQRLQTREVEVKKLVDQMYQKQKNLRQILLNTRNTQEEVRASQSQPQDKDKKE